MAKNGINLKIRKIENFKRLEKALKGLKRLKKAYNGLKWLKTA